MGQILLQGFLVGLAYVAPIGMQNAYVINSAAKLKKSKALKRYHLCTLEAAFLV